MAAEERGTRKLAAIMFTDIKGFSKKMGEDETVAMALLKAHDSMMQELFDKYSGRVIKSIGDSFMVDFSSAVNAVKCAIEAQEILWYYNKGKDELEKIEVRIGVHLGDVISDGNDIYGDGVNIASRIEAFTQPNRICISLDIFNQVKNKMQIRAARMGSMDFKNISEPVDVYEVLIESIPEFAEPSHAPEEAPSRRKVEAATRQSAKEAEMIEEVKQAPKDDQQVKEDQERQQKVQELYSKAEQFFADGNLDGAESEIREIFKLVALHGGAQILQNRIEEERFKKTEAVRLKQAEEERRKYQEDQVKIGDLMQQAIDLVEKEEFKDALERVKAVYEIDRHSSEAHRLEEQIQQALRAKEELKSTEDQIAEDKAREQELLEALAAPKAPSRFRLTGYRTRQLRFLAFIMVGLIVAGLVFLAIRFSSQISGLFFTKRSSLVVIPFAVYPRDADTVRLGEAVSDVVIRDLSRYAPLTVISPRSSFEFNSAGMNPLEYATSLHVETVLLGDIRPQQRGFSWNLQLLKTEDGSLLWEGKLETDLEQFHTARATLVGNVLRALQLDASPNPIRPETNSDTSYRPYLKSLWYMNQSRSDYVRYGLRLLREAITLDTLSASAYAAYGEASLTYYKLTGEQYPSYLRDALQFSQYAIQLDADRPEAYATLAGVYRYAQRFDDALKYIRSSLAVSPNNASAYRELTLLSLIAGDMTYAEQQAVKALSLDPKNPEGNLALALVYHYMQRYPEAIYQYGQAIAGGGQHDSLISTRYVMNAWAASGESERAVQFIRRVIGQNPTTYRTRYWTSRVLQLSGRIRDAQPYLDAAVEQLENILEFSPNDPNARIYLALCYSRLGRFADGLREIDRAVELLPRSYEVLYRKANVLAIQNKKAEALEWLKKAVDAHFDFDEVLSPEFVFLSKDPGFREAVIPSKTSGLPIYD